MDNQFEKQSPENPQQSTFDFTKFLPDGYTFETMTEKRNLGTTATAIGLSLIVALAISDLFIVFLRNILKIFGQYGLKIVAFISDPAATQVFNVILSSIIFTLPFIIVFKLNNFSVSGLIKFKKPKKKDILPYTLIGVGFCAITNIAVSQMGNFFSIFGVGYEVDFGEKPDGLLGFMLTFISTAIIPPLTEEFAFRGFILGSLRKFSDTFAVVASAVLFGLMHGNFLQMPFAFIIGLFLGFVTVKTNTIWISVLIHAINNAVSVIFDYAFIGSPIIIKNVLYVAYLIIAMILGILGIYLLRNRKNAYKLKSKLTVSKTGSLYKWIMTNPAIIVFAVICLSDAVRFFVL